MRVDPSLGHLLGDVAPAGAAFHRERHRPSRGRVEPGQPIGQVFPIGRADPAAFPLVVLLVDPVECQLLPVDVQAAYD